MASDAKRVPSWKIVLAFILDLFTAFFLFGFIVAKFTGDTTESGFELNGTPALIMFALVIAYFVIGSRYLGGTLWQRILKTKRS